MENLAELKKKNSVIASVEKDSSPMKSQKVLKNRFSVNLKTLNMAKVYLEKGLRNSVDAGKKAQVVVSENNNN